MYHVDVWGFYRLAMFVHPLTSLGDDGKPKKLNNTELATCYAMASMLAMTVAQGTPTASFEIKETTPLPRSTPYAERVWKEAKVLYDKVSKGEKVSPVEAQGIKSTVDHFESALKHELEGAPFFFIPQRGTHLTEDLLDHAERNLPSDVVSRLSKECLKDIQEAGKCLVVEASTASGFHILRAVESMIMTYLAKVSSKPISKKNRNWGVYIRELRGYKGDGKVIDYLYHMKEYHRNPIMHPEIALTPREAFSLFNASLSAIEQLDAAIEAWP